MLSANLDEQTDEMVCTVQYGITVNNQVTLYVTTETIKLLITLLRNLIVNHLLLTKLII